MKAGLSIFICSLFFAFTLNGQNIEITSYSDQGIRVSSTKLLSGAQTIWVNGEEVNLEWENGKSVLPISLDRKGGIYRIKEGKNEALRIFHLSQTNDHLRKVNIPTWTSILPPLIAVLLALIFKEVVISLFSGVLIGAFVINGCRFDGILAGFQFIFDTVSVFIIGALNDAGHLSVIVFSVLIGGMVSLITKNGGMMGVLEKVAKYASTRKKVQLLTYTLGIAVFFDDYANTLIVGNTMRSLTDKFKISREKLAYIVDSTAAPISAIAFITTWIGAELGFISGGLDQLENYPFGTSPYAVFLASLKYSFYPILTLIFIYLLIRSGRDYGAMLKAEKRALHEGRVISDAQEKKDDPNMEDLSPVAGSSLNWQFAFWPVLVTIFVTIFGLLVTGMEGAYTSIAESTSIEYSWGSIWQNLSLIAEGDGFFLKCGTVLGLSDSYQALLWSSFSGLMLAVILTVGSKTMSLWDTSHWTIQGFKTMIPAVVILILAWALASTTEWLGTADFIIGLFGEGFHPAFIPGLIFIMAFAISFSTGSSWSTMAILYPLAIPLAWEVSIQYGFSPEDAKEILLNAIATVLAASVLGDHCSPISDTTILSSLASDCNHLDHVKTQFPYAITVGIASLVAVILSSFIGGNWLLSMVLVIILAIGFYLFIRYVGKLVNN